MTIYGNSLNQVSSSAVPVFIHHVFGAAGALDHRQSEFVSAVGL